MLPTSMRKFATENVVEKNTSFFVRSPECMYFIPFCSVRDESGIYISFEW